MQRLARVAQDSGNQTDQSLRQAGRSAGLSAQRVQEIQQYLERASRSAADTSTAMRRIAVPPDIQRDLARLTDQLQDTTRQGERAGENLGEGMQGGLMGKIKGMGGKGGPVAMALVGVAAVGVAAGALLAKGISEGLEIKQANANLQAKFNLDDQTMRKIGTAAGDSYKQAFGESIAGQQEILARAMQTGLLPLKASTSEMTNFANSVDTVNSLLGGETTDTLKAVNALIKNGLANDATEALDLIANAASHNQGATEDLTDSIKEYSNGWKNAGFSGKFALSLINQALDNGVDNTDRASDALREFGRRMIEDPDKIKGAITKAGLPAQELFDQLKEGGKVGEDAFDKLFDSIRNIKDPLDRAAVAQEILGDTAGDFIDAFVNWDPSKAVADFGEFTGAAKKASDIMGSTGQASILSTMRSLEVVGNGVKVSLAEAFGPALDKLGKWVSTHQAEIIEFFTGLGVVVLDTLIGFGKFASGTVGLLSDWYSMVAPTIGSAIKLFGGFGEQLGSLVKHLPGMGKIGEAMEGAGKAAVWYGEQVQKVPGALDATKAAIDGALGPLENARNGFARGGEQAANAARLTLAFGQAMVTLPNGKDVIINSNAPDVVTQLNALGLRLETLPNGQFKVVSNTGEGQKTLDDFIATNNGRKVGVNVIPTLVQNPLVPGFANQTPAPPGQFGPLVTSQPRAQGGIEKPGQAKIANSTVYQWAEAGPEAFIPLGKDKRSRSTQLLGTVADMFGMQLVPMALGGITDMASFDRAAQGIEGAKYVFGGWGDGWNTDCSGAVARIVNMAVNGDPDKGGRFATGNEEEALSARGAKPGWMDGALNVGWVNDPNMPGGGHTAITMPSGVNVEMGGARGNGQFGGKAQGAKGFPNIMHIVMAPSVGPGSGNTTSPGVMPGSPEAMAAAAKSAGTAGDGARVYVTNWPAQLGGGDPKARVSATFFAQGGMEPQILGSTQGVRVWNEPEAGGESYIPHAMDRRGRATGILSATARQFGYQLVPTGAARFAMGGFGGYSNHADDYKWGPHNAYDFAALGVGGAMSVASAFGHIPGMLGSGSLTLGDLAGSGIDTGANSLPGMDQLIKKLDEIAKNTGNPPIKIEYSGDIRKILEQMIQQFRGGQGGLQMPTIQMGSR
jgi:phage-related minor tail protein